MLRQKQQCISSTDKHQWTRELKEGWGKMQTDIESKGKRADVAFGQKPLNHHVTSHYGITSRTQSTFPRCHAETVVMKGRESQQDGQWRKTDKARARQTGKMKALRGDSQVFSLYLPTNLPSAPPSPWKAPEDTVSSSPTSEALWVLHKLYVKYTHEHACTEIHTHTKIVWTVWKQTFTLVIFQK